MSKLVYKTGDLFAHLKGKRVIVPHVTNIFGAMGAGFAATVREKYPCTNKLYEKYCKDYKLGLQSHPNSTLFTAENGGKLVFANMNCQTNLGGMNRNAKYSDLAKCMEDVAEYAEEQLMYNIYAPKFGSGLCGLDWNFVEELIHDVWVSNNLNVTVFTL